MSIEFKASICPNCGAKIHFPEKAERTICQHCGATVFIDRHELKVWIVEKPINLSLYRMLAERVTDTDKEYAISGLAELMSKCDNKVFPYPKSEAKRFIEWMNQRDDITVIKQKKEHPIIPSPWDVFRFYTKGREYEPYECWYCGHTLPRKNVRDDTTCPKCGEYIMHPPSKALLDYLGAKVKANPDKYGKTFIEWLIREREKLGKYLRRKGLPV